MSSKPHLETIEVLRRTLLEVEQQLDPVSDASSIAELKRIVLQRIAALELARAAELEIAILTDGPPTAVPVDDREQAA